MRKETSSHTSCKAGFYVLFAALIWSAAGLLIRGTQCGLFWFLLIRNGTAALVFLPYLIRHRPCREEYSAIAKTCLSYTVFMFSFAAVTRITGSAQAIAGQYTAPLFVWFGIWINQLFSGRKVKQRFSTVFSMLIIAVGCAIGLFQNGHITSLSFLPLVNGILFPLYTVCFHQVKRTQPLVTMTLANLFCAAVAVPFLDLELLPSRTDVLTVGVGGILINGIAYVLFGLGAQKISTMSSVLLCLADPILNPVWVWLLLGEPPSCVLALSLGLILTGGVLNSFANQRRVASS